MAFVKSLITGSSAPAPVVAPVINPFATNQGIQTYGQAQGALANQQNNQQLQNQFVQQLQAQNGLGNQSSVFSQQQALANQLQGIANGTGPNPVQAQFNQATGQNVANQAALMAGQRGSGANVGLLARQIGEQGANTQQQAAGQAATLGAQQQLAGIGALQQQQGMLGSQANQMVNQQQQGIANVNQYGNQIAQNALTNSANVGNAINGVNTSTVGAQGSVNAANASISASQNALAGSVLGGAASGAASALAPGAYKGGLIDNYKSGGQVPGQPKLPGNKPQNDTIPAMLSPKEIVIPNSITMGKNPGERAKAFVEAALAKKKSEKSDGKGTLKRLSQDSTKTVLLHPAGHQIVVAHNALSPEMKQKLSALPQHFDEGGEAEDDDERTEAVDNAISSAPDQSDPQFGAAQTPLVAPAIGQGGGVLPQAGQTLNIPASALAGTSLALNNPQSSDMPGPSSVPQTAAAPGIPPAPTNGYDTLLHGIGEQKAGMSQAATAEGALGKQQQQALNDQLAFNKSAMYAQQNIAKNMKDAYDEFTSDPHNVVDPNRLYANQTTGQKIQTGIALILGGIGGGLLHTANPAVEAMNNAINRDVELQRSQINNRDSLLKANLAKFGSMGDAIKATTASMQQDTSLKMQAQAAGMADPLAKARLLQAAGQLDTSTAGTVQDMAQRRAQMDLMQKLQNGGVQGGTDPAKLVPYVVPKDQQKEVFGEIKTAQNATNIEKDLMSDFDQASQDNTILKTGATPFGQLRTPASILKMKAMTLPLIHDTEGRVNEFEQKTLNDLMPQPGDTDAKIAQKRSGMLDFINQKKAAPTAKGYGIDLQNFNSTTNNPVMRLPPEQQKFAAWAKQNPADPRAQIVLKKLGL